MDGSNEKKMASSVHLFSSCNISHNGPAPVESYFQVSKKSKQNHHHLESHLRGRLLMGSEIKIPPNIQGIYAHTDPGRKILSIGGAFEEINLWKHAELPDHCQFEDSLDWFEIAKAVSGRTIHPFLPALRANMPTHFRFIREA